MGVLSALAVGLQTTTSTLHFRPIAFKVIWGTILFAIALTGFFWVYCSTSEYDEAGNLLKAGNCPVGNRWDSDYWGAPRCLSGYCEQCYMQDYVRSRANSYSNVGFIAGGILIMGFTIEDYIFFNRSGPGPAKTPHEGMDYDSNNPPNLILGGGGLLNPLFGVLATGVMVYAAVGAFVFHAGMTPLSATWDICSVYTLVSLGVPYLSINHLHCIKRHYPRSFLSFVCMCVLLTYYLPYKVREVRRCIHPFAALLAATERCA